LSINAQTASDARPQCAIDLLAIADEVIE